MLFNKKVHLLGGWGNIGFLIALSIRLPLEKVKLQWAEFS